MNGGLDQLDYAIINVLASDARVSNRQIAAGLGVTEGTIRTRIRRLQEDGMIRFSLVKDFRMAGSPNLVMLGIHAEPAHVRALAQTLSENAAINCVIILLGRFNLMAMGLFTSVEKLNDLIRGEILPLKGVHSVETSIAVHALKYDVTKARITKPDVTPDAG